MTDRNETVLPKASATGPTDDDCDCYADGWERELGTVAFGYEHDSDAIKAALKEAFADGATWQREHTSQALRPETFCQWCGGEECGNEELRTMTFGAACKGKGPFS